MAQAPPFGSASSSRLDPPKQSTATATSTSPSPSPSRSGSTPPAPTFLSALSPSKSYASTTTTKDVISGIREDHSPSKGSRPNSSARRRESPPEGSDASDQSDEDNTRGRPQLLSLSMRLDSAMNTSFASSAEASSVGGQSREGSMLSISQELPEQPEEGDGKAEAQQQDAEETVNKSLDRKDEMVNNSRPDAVGSPSVEGSSWTNWPSRAASGSYSLLKQSSVATSNWSTSWGLNPFRSNDDSSERSKSSNPDAGPSKAKAIKVVVTADSDQEDADLARSAAHSLKLGAKNEEKRRRALAKGKAGKERSPKKSSSGPSSTLASGEGQPTHSAETVNPTGALDESAAATSSKYSGSLKGLNVFDYSESIPGSCDPPSQDQLPERKYFILTQAGKPVFLSHLAARRLARDDDARDRIKLRRARRSARQEALDGPIEAAERRRVEQEEIEQDQAEEEARKKDEEAADQEEEETAVQVGVLQALVSNYSSQGTEVLERKSIEILQLPPTSSRVVFLLKPPLYLAVTSTWADGGLVYADNETVLKAHLEILRAGVISLISESQLQRLFSRGHNFDLRRMLEGTDGILCNLVSKMQNDFGMSLGAGGGGLCLRPSRMDLKLREDIASCLSLERFSNRPLSRLLSPSGGGDRGESGTNSPAIRQGDEEASSASAGHVQSGDLDPSRLMANTQVPSRPKDLLYIILLTSDGQLVTLLRPRKLSAYPLDLQLLSNTIAGMSRRSQRESGTVNWIPLCLPRFAPQGMVQAHVSWLDGGKSALQAAAEDSQGAPTEKRDADEVSVVSTDSSKKSLRGAAECALVIVTANREGFEEVSQWRDCVLKALTLPPSPLQSFSHSLTHSAIYPDTLRLPGLRHFVLKKRDDLQVVWSEWSLDPYVGDTFQAQLARMRVGRMYERARELALARSRKVKGAKNKGKQATSATEAETTTTTSAAAEDTSQPDQSQTDPLAWLSTLPAQLQPQADTFAHYLRTPHESVYVEVPPSSSTSSKSRPSNASKTSTSKSSGPGSWFDDLASTSVSLPTFPSPSPYEVFLTLSPNVPPSAARKMAREVVRWGFTASKLPSGEGIQGEKWRLWLSGRGMVF